MTKDFKIGEKIYIPHLNEKTFETYVSQHNIIGFDEEEYNNIKLVLDPSFDDFSEYGERFKDSLICKSFEEAREKCTEILKNKKIELMEQVYKIEENIDTSYELENPINKEKYIKCKLKKRESTMKHIRNNIPEKFYIGKKIYLVFKKLERSTFPFFGATNDEFIIKSFVVSSDENGEPNYSISAKLNKNINNYSLPIKLDKDFKLKNESGILAVFSDIELANEFTNEINEKSLMQNESLKTFKSNLNMN